MEYIVHHRCREKDMTGKDMNLRFGTKLRCENGIIYAEYGPLCYDTSENAHRYFARNDDGQGLRRGALTWAIAYAQRIRYNRANDRVQRFSDAEIETLERDWSRYLIGDLPVILFNHDFFNAEVDELERMADALNIRVKE